MIFSQQLSDFVPVLIIFNLLVLIYFISRINKKDVLTLDGIISIFGIIFGLIVTLMNTVYISTQLFLLGPLISISSAYYLKNRSVILLSNIATRVELNGNFTKLIHILFWFLFSLSLISYYMSPVYHRHITFFIFISISVSLIGIEIFISNGIYKISIYNIISKILILSIFVRASAYFISPYPIGSDPWVHLEYAKEFLFYNHLDVTPGFAVVNQYYVNYPLAHLFTLFCYFLLDISLINSFFMLGVILTFSTLFVYLLCIKLTNNIKISLFAILLLNFANFHIQWGIETIAMSYGIVIYSFIFYLLFSKNQKNHIVYSSISILLLVVIVYAHTISTFILLISLVILSIFYLIISGTKLFETDKMSNKNTIVSNSFILILGILIFINWNSESYPFFERVFSRLLFSLNQEATLLENKIIPNIYNNTLKNTSLDFGYLIYVAMGIIGTLSCLSKKYINKDYFCLIATIVILYIFRYGFPVLGIRNIIPSRWPVFIFITFSIFIAIGFVRTFNNFCKGNMKIICILLILSVTSFFTITAPTSNKDSPIYGEEYVQNFVWTESEMMLFQKIDSLYKGIIITDQQTARRPFEAYLRRDFEKIMFYRIDNNGEIDYSKMEGNVIIWRETSLNRPVTVAYQNFRRDIILGNDFEYTVNNNFNRIYDVGDSRAYK